ncbi:MAG: DMT family transporter [Alphaproteobacteria bacterium]|nr:DMT family transporter [Alphaproteobacteria bacterium]
MTVAQGPPVAVRAGLWMALAAVGYAGMFAIVKFLSAEIDVYVLLFWRYFLALLVFLPWLLKSGPGVLKTGRMKLHLSRGVLMVVHSGTLMVAILFIPLGEATSLIFTAPLFAVLLAGLLLREHVGGRRWAALAMGFAGVLVILRPGLSAFQPAAILVLISAFTGASVAVIGRVLLRTDDPGLSVFYVNLFAVPVALAPALVWWQWPTLEQVPWLIGLGLLANAYIYGSSRALKIAETSLVMPFDFLRLPAAAFAGFLFFAEVLDPWAWLGAAIIFASSVYITNREIRAAKA